MALKTEVAFLAEKLKKLERRVKRDEKEGVLDGEHKKRAPSAYNEFVAKHIHDMTGKTPQERLAECARLYHEEKEGKVKRGHPKTMKEEELKRKRKKEDEEEESDGEMHPYSYRH